jgi:hypothetical protein
VNNELQHDVVAAMASSRCRFASMASSRDGVRATQEKELRRRQQHDPSVEIVTIYRKEVFTLQACGPIDEEDPESEIVPLYGRHRKHLRIEDDDPVKAPFDDLLPCARGVPSCGGASTPSTRLDMYHTQVLPEQAPGRLRRHWSRWLAQYLRRELRIA